MPTTVIFPAEHSQLLPIGVHTKERHPPLLLVSLKVANQALLKAMANALAANE